MTALGDALRSAWLRAPPQNRRAIFLMCYGTQFVEGTAINEEAEAEAEASWAGRDGRRLYSLPAFACACGIARSSTSSYGTRAAPPGTRPWRRHADRARRVALAP